MARVCLIHWNKAESDVRARKLRDAGHAVDAGAADGPEAIQRITNHPPDAVIVDLNRLPSHGREVALFLRRTKATRHVPLVFVDGDLEKVARIRELLPDAVYTSWARVRAAIKRAIANPPTEPVVPGSMAGYSGTPLPKKLGIKAHSVVALVGAPTGFEQTLGRLPDGVTLRKQARGRCDLIVWFTKSCRELERRIDRMAQVSGKGGLWIAWPKKASGVATDLTQPIVRRIGLSAGLVDYKIAAIDETWSGLRFARRKKNS
jgi:CheY-like chemotaxis protein